MTTKKIELKKPELKTYHFKFGKKDNPAYDIMEAIRKELPGVKMFCDLIPFIDEELKIKITTILIDLGKGVELNILTIAEFEKIYKGTISEMEKEDIVKRAVDFVTNWNKKEEE